METDYLIILAPAAQGNLLTAKGSTSFLLEDTLRKVQVLTINAWTETEAEEMLHWTAYSCEQAGSTNNKKFIDNLLQCWQEWEHIYSFPDDFLKFLMGKIKKESLLPGDVILLRNPVEEAFIDETPKPVEAFHNNHLIVCYQSDNYRFPVADIVDIQHFDNLNHVILVNSNNSQDFRPFLQEAKRELERQDPANQKQIGYVTEVLGMLKDDFYHRRPNWELLHRIKKALGLKNLKMAQYQFMVSA